MSLATNKSILVLFEKLATLSFADNPLLYYMYAPVISWGTPCSFPNKTSSTSFLFILII
ncbi:hypothetical protein RBEAN4_0814 [Rickettsia bellii str. RML An4]|uniref:Uncharacterized protein n=1 Tax=Rickettsia bellii str. RML An4 TaxID=1359193 RepID=A0A0F3QC29_RICBE|nr:hypothetical protein RBEAN4_0814 [Rickettsia bellii str. RML An4]